MRYLVPSRLTLTKPGLPQNMAMKHQKSSLPITLLDLLNNTLVLSQISPHVGVQGLLSLAATSTAFRDLIFTRPHVFSHLDLTRVKSCLKLLPEIDEHDSPEFSSISTDDYYARPLRNVFSSLKSRNVLQDVRTLVLDGLAVPLGLVREILCEEAYNIRIISLRCVKELGDEKLIQLLRYLIRPSRKEPPKLKGLYYFTPTRGDADYSAANLRLCQRQQQGGVTNSLGAQLGAGASSSGALHRELVQSCWHQNNPWYGTIREVLRMEPEIAVQWASLIEACEGLIAFDAVLCRQHNNVLAHPEVGHVSTRSVETIYDARPSLATISLSGCQKCGSSPEGPACPGKSPESQLPLLTPPPMHSSSVKAAQRLGTNGLSHPQFIARCRQCLKDRWCESCNAWWCDSCYTVPKRRVLSTLAPPSTDKENLQESIKVHNALCVKKCLVEQLLNEGGEGGMWG